MSEKILIIGDRKRIVLPPEINESAFGRKLLTVPDKRLRQKCMEIKVIDECIRELAEFLLAQLEIVKAVGLAAPQYGEMLRLIVIRFGGIERVIINPEIVKRRGKHFVSESCRSIPGKAFKIERPKLAKVVGKGLNGERVSLKGHDLLAQCICHEVDHLDGILVDKRSEPVKLRIPGMPSEPYKERNP